MKRHSRWWPISVVALLLLAGVLATPAAGQQSAQVADFFYVGDVADNTIKRFDLNGAYLGKFVTNSRAGLKSPRGVIFDAQGALLVADQNVTTSISGEVLRYGGDGRLLDRLINHNDQDAPFAPRGIVLGNDNILYVADLGDFPGPTGRVATYDGVTGAFLGDRDPAGFSAELRPRGLVFGPDGALYVTSFQANPNDTDKILIFSGTSGACLGQIELDQVGQPRAYAQALLFGPGGDLFLPISGGGPDTGSVRRYRRDEQYNTFDVLVAPGSSGGPVGAGWYLTFGKTNPSTLAYGD